MDINASCYCGFSGEIADPEASNFHKMLNSSFHFSLQFFFRPEWRESVKPCPFIQANDPPGTYLLCLLISHQGRGPKNFHQPPANTSGPDEAFFANANRDFLRGPSNSTALEGNRAKW